MASIDKELEFNILNRISLLYNQKTDNTGIHGLDDMFNTLTPTQKRHMCAGYCYNNAEYEFCSLCPSSSKSRSTPLLVSGNTEPGYAQQFNTKLSSDTPTTDTINYNKTDLIPFNINDDMTATINNNYEPIKVIEQNGKKYNLYAPYIVIKEQ